MANKIIETARTNFKNGLALIAKIEMNIERWKLID